jgi:WD40 repeat protein
LLIVPTFYIGARIITPTKAKAINILDDFLTGEEIGRIDDDELKQRENCNRITFYNADGVRNTSYTSSNWFSVFAMNKASPNLLSESVASKRVTIIRKTDAFFSQDVRKELKQNDASSPVLSCDVGNFGSRIVSGHEDENIRLFDISTGLQLSAFEGHEAAVKCVRFSKDGSKIASGSFDEQIRIWNSATGECLHVLRGHKGPVSCVVFCNTTDRIISSSYDTTIRIWDLTLDPVSPQVLELKGHTKAVSSVAINSDDRLIASGSYDFSIRIWFSDTGQQIRELRAHIDVINTVVFHHKHSIVASGSNDNLIKLWDVDSGQTVMTLKGHSAAVNSICFSSDGKNLISGSADKSIRIWDLDIARKKGEDIIIFEGHKYPVRSVAYDYFRKRIISGSDDGSIREWNAVISNKKGFVGLVKRLNMSILKVFSRLFAIDAHLFSFITSWLSSMRVAFVKGSKVQKIFDNWSDNKFKDDRDEAQSELIMKRREDFQYNRLQKEINMCFADFSRKRTIEETRKWKDIWNSKIPNYLELCQFEFDELKKKVEITIKDQDYSEIYKQIYRLCCHAICIALIALGIGHMITDIGKHNFWYAFEAYQDFLYW